MTQSNIDIAPLSRLDLYMKLGLVSMVEPMTEELMVERAERELREDEHDSPHERAWHLSYHASAFPGDPEDACARQLVYRMMNIPTAAGATPPWVTATGEVGKAIELDIARAWFEGGRMLGVPEDPSRPDQYQLGFRDREHWLTGSTDLAVLPPGWTRPHIVEVKAKSQDVIDEMISGRLIERNGVVVTEPRGPDEAHVRQLKATIGLAHEHDWGEVVVCKHSWRILWSSLIARLRDMNPRCPEHGYDCQHAFRLEQPTTGEIAYRSRSWPMGHPRHGPCRKSFFYEHDPAFMERGRAVLREARWHFEQGTLPLRPRHAQWSLRPCQYCPAKPYCRLDSGVEAGRRKVTTEPVALLAESNGIAHARTIRPGYAYEAARARVLDEWRGENG